ncbi:MAG: lipopolysaccharide biosynthesis protein [Candidatus Bipolaricaulota bacterium]
MKGVAAARGWLKNATKIILPKGRFARSVAVLAGGAVLGQAITVLASPILTRLYGPDDFGVMAVYMSLLGIVSVIASLRYQLAIPLPEKDEDAANLLALSLGIVFLMSALACLGVCLFTDQIIGWVNVPALRPYLWLLPLGIGMVGTYQVFNYWAVRKRAFGRIARTKINQGLGSVLTQIGFGILRLGPIGLILGQIVGQAAGTTTLATLAWKQDVKALKAINPRGMSHMAARYIRFPLFSSWSGVLNTLSVQVPTLMLSFFFGSAITGLYALSHRVMSLPLQLVGQAVAQVFFPTAVEAHRNDSIATTTQAIFRRLVLIGVPAFLLIGLAAPQLFTVVFGKEWRQAGTYVQWLTPWMFLVFVSSPFTMLPSVMEKQRQEVVFNGLLLSSRVGALCIGGFLNSERVAIASFAGVSALCWLGFLLWTMNLSGNKVKYVLEVVLSEATAVVPLLLPLIAVKIFADRGLYVLGAAGLSGVLVSHRLLKKLKLGR